MSKERLKVLDMLKEGIISAEDALKLLDKLSVSEYTEDGSANAADDNCNTTQNATHSEPPQTIAIILNKDDEEQEKNSDDTVNMNDNNCTENSSDDATNGSGNTNNTNTGNANTDSSNTDSSNADSSNTDSSNADSSNTDSSNTDSSNTDSSNTDDTMNQDSANGDSYNYGYSNNYSNRNGSTYSSYNSGQSYADWANDIKNNILESTRNLTNYISSQAYVHTYGPFGFGSQMQTFEMESNEISSNISSLNLTGKNDKVEVIGYNGTTIKITATYKAKGSMDPRIHFEDGQGNYGVFYDYNAVYAMGLYVKVPYIRMGSLHVETKNSSILLSDLQVERADIVTKNAPIYLTRLKGKELIADSSNAPIKTDTVHFKEIRFKTSNSNITIREFEADIVLAKTSNAAISLDAIDVGHVEAFTSNASISINTRYGMPTSKYSLHNVNAKTNNGHINIRISELIHSASRLKASTSYGKLSIDLGNTEYYTKTSNYIDAKTPGYENASNKWNLDLQTSNASIYVKP